MFTQEVGLQYLSHLLQKNKFVEAAENCQEILGKNTTLWEETVCGLFILTNFKKLFCMSNSINISRVQFIFSIY